MDVWLLVLSVLAAAAGAPADNTLRLPVIGATIRMPAGATWKAETFTDNVDHVSFDRLERSSPATPELTLLFKREVRFKSCSKFVKEASKEARKEGLKVGDAGGLVPASWDSRAVTGEGFMLLCYETNPGVIVAEIGVEDVSDETKPGIRALLESVAGGLRK